jgi:hypothetical protein
VVTLDQHASRERDHVIASALNALIDAARYGDLAEGSAA